MADLFHGYDDVARQIMQACGGKCADDTFCLKAVCEEMLSEFVKASEDLFLNGDQPLEPSEEWHRVKDLCLALKRKPHKDGLSFTEMAHNIHDYAKRICRGCKISRQERKRPPPEHFLGAKRALEILDEAREIAANFLP